MSYGLAYTTRFESLDGTLYGIEISIEGFDGRPMEISLDGDAPCVIEWQECGKADVIHSSTCTLRVSNERDRQMLQLMNCRDAKCDVFLILANGKRRPYWVGLLDDAVYEEPYSFKTGYVTEVVFSDFGVLNRSPFTLKGRQTLHSVIYDCLAPTAHANAPIGLCHTLLDPDGGTLRSESIMVDCGRFVSGGSRDSEVMKREVLEDVLRPFGLRIVQRDGKIYLHDIEYLLGDASMQSPVVWKGTDAALRADAAYGRFEVTFEQDAEETLAEAKPGLDRYEVEDRYRAYIYDPFEGWLVGFYIGFRRFHPVQHFPARAFKTRPWLSDGGYEGYAWRVKCYDSHIGSLPSVDNNVINNPIVTDVYPQTNGTPVAGEMFFVKTDFVPICPDYEDYRLRINLDLLFSPKKNPMEGDDNWNFNGVGFDGDDWKEMLRRAYVPVKLELLDGTGRALMHYVNTTNGVFPKPIGAGRWERGAASSFGEMLLAYYKDGYDSNPLGGWATNRQTMPLASPVLPSLYRKLPDGEYVPMPYAAGYLRLTVSNCVCSPDVQDSQALSFLANNNSIRWHLLRNAKITLVKANAIPYGIDNDDIACSDDLGTPNTGRFTETHKVGSWQKGVAPSARGLLSWNTETLPGDAVYLAIKDGIGVAPLSTLRLVCMRTQLSQSQPTLSGTAKLRREFLAFTDASTPGVFLVTALRQDLHQSTEEVTMVRIAEKTPLYIYEWEDPICATEWTAPYEYDWEDPVCAMEWTAPYEYDWGNPVCVMNKQ